LSHLCFVGYSVSVFTAYSELRKVLFLVPSATVSLWFFVCVYGIYLEPLNGFAPNSRGRHIWSLAWMSLNVKVKGQGHWEQKLAFVGPLSSLHAVCVW